MPVRVGTLSAAIHRAVADARWATQSTLLANRPAQARAPVLMPKAKPMVFCRARSPPDAGSIPGRSAPKTLNKLQALRAAPELLARILSSLAPLGSVLLRAELSLLLAAHH